MSASRELPDHDRLVAELGSLRERGLPATRSLVLPNLRTAVGLIAGRVEDEILQSDIEAVLREAIDQFGGGDMQQAAARTFGLEGGLKLASATDRRRRAAECVGVSPERFRKDHERRIRNQVAEGILDQCRTSREPSPAAAGTADVSTGESVGWWRQGRILRAALILAVVAIVVGVGAAFVSDHRSRSEAIRLEQQYDGKDPQGLNGADSRCADPPPSLEVKASRPPILGPDGTVVGVVELRTSVSCPGVVWARVPWNNDRGEADPGAVYQIPAGWVLHVVTHRPGTATSADTPEPSVAGPIPYGLSTMLTTARGCVYVEAYFSNGDDRTVSALTPCVTP